MKENKYHVCVIVIELEHNEKSEETKEALRRRN